MQENMEEIQGIFDDLELTAYADRSQFLWQAPTPAVNFDVVVSNRSDPFDA